MAVNNGVGIIKFKEILYFLDPEGRNTAHLPNDSYHKKIKVTSYEDFEKLFFKIYNNEFDLNNLNTDDYCLDSSKTHEKIFEILNND